MNLNHKYVQDAHKNYDNWQKEYTNHHAIGISCKAGCAWCCRALVMVSLWEVRYMLEHLTPEQHNALLERGVAMLEQIKHNKHNSNYATTYFTNTRGCALLGQQQQCTAHAVRPLACRGVLTNLSADFCKPGALLQLEPSMQQSYNAQLSPHHGPEHYLSQPWRKGEAFARRLWKQEREQAGFCVIGELSVMVYLCSQPEFNTATNRKQMVAYLKKLDVWGGQFGIWVEA